MIKIAIILFIFMTAIDVTILATIMPNIIATLGDMQLYPIMSSAYLVAFFITTPIFGKVSDHFGVKHAAITALVTFLIGSLCAGLSWSMSSLSVARLVQGAGAGGLTNVSFITIGRLYSTDKKRSLMQALLSSVWAIASIVGPLIGAFIATLLSWRFVFFINIPLGCVAGIFLVRFTEVHTRLQELFDRKGIVLFISSVLLVFIVAAIWKSPSFSSLRWIGVIAAIGCILVFIRHCLKVPSPVIPFHLLKVPLIAVSIVFGVISGACLTMSYTLISLFIQGALRKSMEEAGFVIMATSIGWAAGSFFCGMLLHKIKLRSLLLIAIIALITAFSLLLSASITITLSFLIVTNFILGFGIGAIVNCTITGVQKASSGQFLGRATSFLSLARSFGMSVGAMTAGFLQLFYFRKGIVQTISNIDVQYELLQTPSQFLTKNFADTVSTETFQQLVQIFASSIQSVFIIPLIILVLAIPLVYLLPIESRR